MAEVMSTLNSLLTGNTSLTVTLLFFTAIIVIYSVFVFYFYRFLAKKNIIELNLNQYNQYEDPTTVKLFAILFYVVEYVILLPILTFFWFGVLSSLILILAKDLDINIVLLISAALVAAVRMTSYISQNLSKDLAKMLPFTFLAIAITQPGFFEIAPLVARISEIPSLFSNLPYYLIFIVAIELIMRCIEFTHHLIRNQETGTD